MKKKKLFMKFFIATLLMGGIISPFKAKAQTWTGTCNTASYNFSYTTGSAVAAGDNYFLYNIGAGCFLTGGMDWGSHASADHAGKVITLTAKTNGYSIYTAYYSANGVENNGYLATNGYTDGSDDANWVFTPVTVNGYTNAYTIKTGNDYLYYDASDTRVQIGSSTGNNYSYWLLIPRSARNDVGDYTYYLQNVGINRPWERQVWCGYDWDQNNRGDWKNQTNNGWSNHPYYTVGGNDENPCGEKYHNIFDFYQTISQSLPEGRYRLYAQAFWRDGSSGETYLYLSDAQQPIVQLNANGENTTESMAGASTAFSSGHYVNSVEKFFSSDTKNVRLGINMTTANQWVVWDNFVLQYLGKLVKDYAVALPSGSDMTADTWYYYDIPTSDEYEFTSSAAATFSYTTDGDVFISDNPNTTWTFSAAEAKNISLTSGRIYLKTNAATELTISYKYTLSEDSKTSSISANDYVGAATFSTFTLTYPNAITNDPDASFAIIGSPVATLKKNGSTVATSATLVADPTTKTITATFSDYTLTANSSDYNISIPAGSFGYDSHAENTAITINFKTPALLDQTAFLKDYGSGLFLARGADWGTRAKLDEYGTATVITTDANGYTTFKFVDTDRYLYYDGSNNLYCDGNGSGDAYKWIVTLNDGKYRLTGKTKTTGTDYVKYDDGDNSYLLWANIANKSGENIVGWMPVDASDYGTLMTNKKNSQASTAASAAGLSATTPAELESAVSDWAQGKVIASTSVTTTAEKFKQGQTNPAPITIVSGEIEISTPGLYKFSMQAFYRMRGNNENYTLHTDGFDSPAAYVFFGDAKTQIASVFDHAESSAYSSQDYANSSYHYPNGQNSAKVAFQNSYYTNTVWKYVSQAEIDAATDGKFTYGIVYQGWPNYVSEWDNGTAKLGVDQWCCWAIESADLTLYAENNVDFVKDYVHYYNGTYATAPTLEVTDAVPVVDVTNATFTSGTSAVTFTNPNGLVFVSNDGQTSATKNEVIGTTCASLQLEKGHPFINPKEFTATAAKYTLSSDELAGGSFATLMIPFAASLPSGGSAYSLDQGVNLIDGNIRGTTVSPISANSPVLVTANGNYTGSSVTVPVVEAGATYTNGELVGTYTAMDAPESSYVLQNHTNGEGVAFYLVGSTKPTVNPFRAYIMAQSSNVRALQFLFDEETGIKTIDKGQLTKGNVAYDLQGRRISVPSVFSEHSVLPKGLYIVNGKKVVIK